MIDPDGLIPLFLFLDLITNELVADEPLGIKRHNLAPNRHWFFRFLAFLLRFVTLRTKTSL